MNTDQKLTRSIKAGENHLLESFYKKNFPIIAHYVKQNNGNEEDAQDIFQEAIIVLVGKVKKPNFILTATLSTYLFAISKNIWLKHLRDNKFIHTEQFDSNRHDVEISIDENETIHQENKVLGWLNLITQHCQEILKAIFFYNQPIDNLMIKMGWKNKHTASNQKYKCIQQLKKVKEKDE